MNRLVGLIHRTAWDDGELHYGVEEAINITTDNPKLFKKWHKALMEDWRIAYGINCVIVQEGDGPEEMHQYMRLDYPEHRKHRWVRVYGGWVPNPEEVVHPWQNYCLLSQRVHNIKQMYSWEIGRHYGIDEQEALDWYARNREFLLNAS